MTTKDTNRTHNSPVDRREFLKRSGAASLVVGGMLAGQANAEERAKRPNILFIMTDQQHAGMMSCTGNANVETPALDRLAASGTRFERAYATNPVCVPSRFSLQTGYMPSAIGMRMNEGKLPVPDVMLENSLPSLMRGAGYECAYGGKVHVPQDLTKQMFQRGYEKLTSDDREELADVSAEFIKRPHEKPFFLFVSFMNPHDICYMGINDHARAGGKPESKNIGSVVCEEILDQARASGDLAKFVRENCPPLPENFEPPENEPECIASHYISARSFRKFERDEWSDDMWRLHRWLYVQLTERVDANIGRVLKAVKEAGLEDETLIVFTSDHGDMDSAHRLEHKSIPYEEAARIPFIMSWKDRIPAGRVDDEHLISNGLDLLPTLCDYAQVDIPQGLAGRSVRPVVEGGREVPWRDSVVVESQNGRMVRTDQFKYCVFDCGKNREVLIDLRSDPGEMNNLAEKAQYADVLNRHRRLLIDWCEAQNDAIGLPYLVKPV